MVENLTSRMQQEELVHQDYPPVYSYSEDILVGIGDSTGGHRIKEVMSLDSRKVIIALTDADMAESALERIWSSIRHDTTVLVEDKQGIDFPELNIKVISDGLELEVEGTEIHFHVLDTPREPIIAVKIGEYLFIRGTSDHTKKKEVEDGYGKQNYLDFFEELKQLETEYVLNVSALGYYNNIDNRIESVKNLNP